MKTYPVKELRIDTETIRERCATYYKTELNSAMEALDYRSCKEFLDKFISVRSREHENDLAHHVLSETEIVLDKEQITFLRKNKDSHVAVLNEDGEHIALFPHRELTY